VQSGFLLDIVIRQGPSVLELLARKDETLLVRGNALFVLDLGLERGGERVRYEFAATS
jgi:hypothetical protein